MDKEIAGYVRVSTVRQKMDGVSIEMQKEMIIKHALMMELISKKEEIIFYVDDGWSGKSLERPQIKQLIKKIKKEEIELLLCYDLSRLSRDLFDCNTLLRMFKNHNVNIKCIYDNADFATAGDRFTTNIKILNNQYERERIVERTNDGLISIAESGRYPNGGIPPFGYMRGKDKNIYVHPGDGQIVKMIFEMGSKGYGITEIELAINKIPNSRDRYIKYESIRRMIRNRIYTGYFVFKGKEYNNIVPKIVDEKTYSMAQRAVKRITSTRRHYIFDNKVVCAECGCVLANTHGTSRGRKYFYYKCKKCRKNISERALNKYMLETAPAEQYTLTKEKMIKSIDRKIKNIIFKMENLRERYVDDLITDDEYLYLIMPLDQKYAKLKKEKKKLEKQVEQQLRYSDMISENDKHEYVSTYINRIIVDLNTKRVIEVVMKMVIK